MADRVKQPKLERAAAPAVSENIFSRICVLVPAAAPQSGRFNEIAALARSFEASLTIVRLHDRHHGATNPALHPALDSTVGAAAPASPDVVRFVDVDCRDKVAIANATEGADLVAMEFAHTPNESPCHQGLTEFLLARTSLPTLLIPQSFKGALRTNKVLLAWDASDQARRAMLAAMPLLKRASQVFVCALSRYAGDATRLETDKAVETLRQQGIPAQAIEQIGTGTPDDASALLWQANAQGCDLLVAGAFGHPRWQQQLMGGVTRSFLLKSSVPLLMQH